MIGQTLGHYHVEAQLGEGGTGLVYRARDTKLERAVAIKMIAPRALDASARAHLLREARAASGLNHPHICTVYEVSEIEGQTFIVMEHVDGRPLNQIVPQGGLSVEDVLRYGLQIADALAHAHERGLVHRDLKSANIVVTRDGRAKVLDFGLATRRECEIADVTRSRVSLDEAGVIAGTLPYLAPEVLRGAPADARSDLWSFGVVLHELASGVWPFSGQTGFELAAAILHESPAALPASIPVTVRRVIQRCLAKDPVQRYQRASEVRAVLETLQSEAVPAPGPSAPSIAVLPFADLSPQKDQEYFCDGIAEELINALTKVDGLQVTSRTSSFQFKQTAQDISRIGAQLKVRFVLEGSVRKAGDRLRITAQLISVADGYHVWSERYDREMKDVFAIQDEISLAVVETLRVKLFGVARQPLVKNATRSLEAYDLYLQGRYHVAKWHGDAWKKAAECFQRAIDIDAEYAPAYAGLAQGYVMAEYWGVSPVSPTESGRLGKAAALRALEIDDTLADAHVALGIFGCFYEWDWTGADRELRRAIQLNPANADAHLWYGIQLAAMGRSEESAREVKRAHELNPLSLATNGSTAATAYYTHDYDRAIQYCLTTIEMEPAQSRAHYYLGRAYLAKNMFPEAVAALRTGNTLPAADRRIIGVLGYAYAKMGRLDDAERLLQQIKDAVDARASILRYSSAVIQLGLDQTDEALDTLRELYEQRSPLLRWLKVDPLFDSVRSDVRFQGILRGMGLESSVP